MLSLYGGLHDWTCIYIIVFCVTIKFVILFTRFSMMHFSNTRLSQSWHLLVICIMKGRSLRYHTCIEMCFHDLCLMCPFFCLLRFGCYMLSCYGPKKVVDFDQSMKICFFTCGDGTNWLCYPSIFFLQRLGPTSWEYSYVPYLCSLFLTWQVKLREMKPGMLSQELKDALGMPDGAPPPWLINMQVGLEIFPSPFFFFLAF